MAAEPAPAARDRFGWIERVIALASLGTAVAYVAVRTASILFYGGLGVTPEDLGLGELDLLARSVGLLVIAFAVSAAVASVVAWLAVGAAMIRIWDSVIQPLIDELYGAPGWFQGIVIAGGIVALGVGIWRGNLLQFAMIVLYPAGGLVGYLIWGRRRGGLDGLPAALRLEARRQRLRLRWLFGVVWRPAAAVAAIASLATLSVVVTSSANYAAGAVRRGEAYRDWTVPWGAEPATVRWLTPPAVDPLAGRCLMYLGQSNAALVLYDVGSRQVVRVPPGQVVLLVDTAARTCSSG